MKYYQVLPKFDGLQVLRWSDRARGLIVKRELIAGELYARGEFKRLLAALCRKYSIRPREVYTAGHVRELQANLGGDFPGVRDGVQIFREVTIPKNKTYWNFGARFPFHDLQEGGAENALC